MVRQFLGFLWNLGILCKSSIARIGYKTTQYKTATRAMLQLEVAQLSPQVNKGEIAFAEYQNNSCLLKIRLI